MTSLCFVLGLLLAAAPPPQRARDALAAEARALSPEQLLARARSLNGELEFDKLVPFAQELVSRPDAPLPLKRDGWLLLGTALVILGDPVAAERPFTQLLRVEPGFQAPPTLEPKVALVFKKVQAEERELARALKVADREARIGAITITGDAPAQPRGGQPLPFTYTVSDPSREVRAVRVAYRAKGQSAFSSLALTAGEGGAWSGAIPGALTQSEQGLTLEYYVETADLEGPLRLRGEPEKPLSLEVAAGKLAVPWRAPLPRWAFFTSGAITIGAAAVGTTFLATYLEAQSSFTRYATSGEPLSFALKEQMRLDGEASAQRATIGLISAGSMLAITIIIAVLTDWRD